MIKTGKVVGYSENMKGIVLSDGKNFELDGVLKDETVEIELENYGLKKSLSIKKIINKSNDRIKPMCQISNICGGCNFDYINYQKEISIKKEWITKLFKDKFKYNKTIEVVGMEDPFYYRNKGQIALKPSKSGIIGGFYVEGTHKIISVDNCIIQDEIINEIQSKILKILIKNNYSAYDEDKKRGIFRHILVKRSKATKEVLVVLVTAVENFPGKNNLAKLLVKEIKEITTIVQNYNPRTTSAVLGEKEYVLYGPGFIFDIMHNNKFKITSKSFYQINSVQTNKLYSLAISQADLDKNDVLLDAYSGVGTIGIFAAKMVKQVISVELNKDAVKNAIQNAKYNNIQNIYFYQDDATNFILRAACEKTKIDVVIMDPPRSGSTKEFINALLELKPKKIIYISCNPLTQVEDLRGLVHHYKLDNVVAVDMFPRTANVESVVCLKLK